MSTSPSPAAGVALPRALVRYDESAPPLRFRPRSPSPAQPRHRRFPDDGLGPVVLADIADETRVDLTYRDGHELTGKWAGGPVELNLVVPAHDATATGTFTGSDVSATWQLGDNSATWLEAADGGIGGSAGGTMYVEGSFADSDVSLFATIAGGYKAIVRGQVAEKLIGLDAKAAGRSVRVAGTYEGPSALLAIIVVTLLHFLVAP